MSLDHELLRNVLLNVIVSYETDDWKGIDRTDKISGLGAGVKYLLNRNVYLGLTYTFSPQALERRRADDALFAEHRPAAPGHAESAAPLFGGQVRP